MTLDRATANQVFAREVTSTTTHNGNNYTLILQIPCFSGGGNQGGGGENAGAPNSKLKGVAYGALILGGAVLVIAIGAQASAVAGTAVAAKAGIGATYAMLKGLAAKSAVAAALA